MIRSICWEFNNYYRNSSKVWKYYKLCKNIIYERFKIFHAKQKPGQSVQEYKFELQGLTPSCE